MLQALYERAIAEADKRRWNGEANAEAALRSFWAGYLDVLVSLHPFVHEVELTVLRRGYKRLRKTFKLLLSSAHSRVFQPLGRCGHGICASWFVEGTL